MPRGEPDADLADIVASAQTEIERLVQLGELERDPICSSAQ
jgi:hypothetical protein